MTIDFVVRRHDASHHVRFADSVLLPKLPVFKRRPVNPKQRQTETKFFLPAINGNDKHLSEWTRDDSNLEVCHVVLVLLYEFHSLYAKIQTFYE